jgi:trans-aconitate methyltransferase
VSTDAGPASDYRLSRLHALHFSVPPFASWEEKNHASIVAALPAEVTGRVLDIAGGEGKLGRMLALEYPKQDVLSIDPSTAMTDHAHAEPSPSNLRFETRTIWDVDGTFELVVCAGHWEFYPLQTSATRLVELLAPGGMAIINTLGPAIFGHVRASVFHQVLRTKLRLHRPQSLTNALEARGCVIRWNPVNLLEGSYTMTVRRPR